MNLYKYYPTLEVPRYLNPESIHRLQTQWNVIAQNKYRVVVLKGKTDAFCLGMDLDWVASETINQEDINTFIDFLNKLMTSPMITVAAVNGAVTGGGLGITAACDFTMATFSSSFRLTEGMFGLVPGVIMSALLNRISRPSLKKMVFSAKKYTVHEAFRLGLVDEITTEKELKYALDYFINSMMVGKKQSVQDLKMLLKKALNPNTDLMTEGAILLQKRLGEPLVKNRLSLLASLKNE